MCVRCKMYLLFGIPVYKYEYSQEPVLFSDYGIDRAAAREEDFASLPIITTFQEMVTHKCKE